MVGNAAAEGSIVGTARGHRVFAARGLIPASILVSTAACAPASHSVSSRRQGQTAPLSCATTGRRTPRFSATASPTSNQPSWDLRRRCALGPPSLLAAPVTIWSLPGERPADVIGRRVYPERFVVYVADSVRRSDRARILARLWPGPDDWKGAAHSAGPFMSATTRAGASSRRALRRKPRGRGHAVAGRG